MSQMNHEELVKLYLSEIRAKDLPTFKAGTLAELDTARAEGEVASTGSGDESTQIRLSPIPIERRYAAALEAVEMWEAAGGDPAAVETQSGNNFGYDWSAMTAGG